jgi:hypothetical protein
VKLKILGQTYTVEYISEQLMRAAEVAGICGLEGNHIYIAMGLHPDRLQETILHEINHVIWFQLGLGAGPMEEERIVDAFAKGWTAVLRDNPAKVLKQLYIC